MIGSLCETCEHCREVTSGKGSRFFLCRLSQQDPRWPKYPPQPVIRCRGYCAATAAGGGETVENPGPL